MEHRKSKRSLRVALVLGAAVAGTALVGWGGLAAWNAYTENAGNSVAAGTLTHANGLSCVSRWGRSRPAAPARRRRRSPSITVTRATCPRPARRAPSSSPTPAPSRAPSP